MSKTGRPNGPTLKTMLNLYDLIHMGVRVISPGTWARVSRVRWDAFRRSASRGGFPLLAAFQIEGLSAQQSRRTKVYEITQETREWVADYFNRRDARTSAAKACQKCGDETARTPDEACLVCVARARRKRNARVTRARMLAGQGATK